MHSNNINNIIEIQKQLFTAVSFLCTILRRIILVFILQDKINTYINMDPAVLKARSWKTRQR